MFDQSRATIAFVAKLLNHIRIITPGDIINFVKQKLDLDINYMEAWHTKERALKILKGRLADSTRKCLYTYTY